MSVTFLLNCYNEHKYIRDAVRSALNQDYEPLEILISDNHSTDGTLEIVQEEIARYSGGHAVRLLTNSENIGLENFARSVEAANGEFIIGAHGDDISYPSRATCLVEAWRATRVSLLSSNVEIIDEHSQALRLINSGSEAKQITAHEFAKEGFSTYAHGASLAWHRDVFEKFARLDQERLWSGHDHVLPFRATLLNGHYYIAEPLLQWRVHGRNFGLEAADRTQDKVVQRENRKAYDLGARICMLNDLDEFIARSGKRPDLATLRETLLEGIVSLTRSWSETRNRLFAEGKRPTWVHRQELEQHPNYGTRSEAGIAKKLYRKLIKLLKR